MSCAFAFAEAGTDGLIGLPPRYMDHYDGHYYYSESDDLKTWSTMQPLPNGMSTVARHGTVFLQILDQPAVEGPKVPKIGNFTNIKVLAPATKTAA